MKKVLTLIVMMTFVGALNAQGLKGFLNKAKEKIDKVTNNTGKTTSSTTETSSKVGQSSTQGSTRQAGSGLSDEVRVINGIAAVMKDFETEDPRDVTPYIEKYATHKKTANTKTITVDNLSGIVLGYYSENRAFAYVPSDGIFCFDEKGNIVKKWGKEEAGDMYLLNFGSAVPRFDSGRIMVDYRKGFSIVCDGVIYDKNFREIKRFNKVGSVSPFVGGIAYYGYSKIEGISTKHYTVFVDVNGNQILKSISDQWNKANISFDPNYLRSESEGLIAYCVPDAASKKTKWGFRDAKGNIVIPAKYDMARDFKNGLAAVATGVVYDAKWGFIDKQGNMVIPQKFSIEPSSFDECGLAMVLDKDKKATFVDKQGNINPKRFDRISPFYGGVAIWQEPHGPYVTKLVDSKFNVLKVLDSRMVSSINNEKLYEDVYFADYIRERMGRIRPFGDYFYLQPYGNTVSSNVPYEKAAYMMLDKQGNIITGGVSGCYVDGLAPVFINQTDEIGYVNMNGEWVIKFERSEF